MFCAWAAARLILTAQLLYAIDLLPCLHTLQLHTQSPEDERLCPIRHFLQRLTSLTLQGEDGAHPFSDVHAMVVACTSISGKLKQLALGTSAGTFWWSPMLLLWPSSSACMISPE